MLSELHGPALLAKVPAPLWIQKPCVNCVHGSNLICRGSLQDATYCYARSLLVCNIFTFINVTSVLCFDLIISSSCRYFFT